MSLATAILPTNPDELRAFAQALQSELYAKTLHIEKPKAQLAQLKRARFGQSCEKLDRQIDLLELIIGELEEGEAESEARTTSTPTPGAVPRWPNRRAPATASRCLLTCRARSSPMLVLAPVRPAARSGCARSPTMSARCWNMCHPTLRWWCTCAPSSAAATVRPSPSRRCPACRSSVAGRCATGPCGGGQVLRSPAAEPPIRDLCPRGRRAGPLDAGRLDRARGLAAAGRSRKRSATTSAPGRPCTPTIRRSRCWSRAAAAPGRVDYGWWCAMSEPGARPIGRQPITSTRPIAKACTPRRC